MRRRWIRFGASETALHCILFLFVVILVRFVTAALNQGKETFRKLKTSVSSAELRARMCKAGSSSNDAVRLMQKQQLVQQHEHAPHPPQEPLSSAAAAAAAAAIDVSAALHGPIIIPRPVICSLPTDSLLQTKTAPPPPTSTASIDIILGRNSVAHPVKELRNIALTISAAVCDGAAFQSSQTGSPQQRTRVSAAGGACAAQVHAAAFRARALAGVAQTAAE